MRLCDSAVELLRRLGPVGALSAWGRRFFHYMHVKQGMADALPGILHAKEGLRLESRTRIRDAIAVLLDAGRVSEEFRSDVTADTVMMAFGGITLITEHERDEALGERLLDLFMDGLRTERAS